MTNYCIKAAIQYIFISNERIITALDCILVSFHLISIAFDHIIGTK